MIKKFMMFAAVTLCTISCDQSQIRQPKPAMPATPELEKEIRRVMGNGIYLDERKRQIPAIAAAFARRTDHQRAFRLATLCYQKTLDTPLMPLDMAEIALAETGSHGLSAKAVSPKGALGVWQLMPNRARSHGYSPEDMENDEKCAEAAVRELLTKMEMARGNLRKAKKLYCGIGPQADAYEEKRKRFRREIMREMMKSTPMRAENSLDSLFHSS